MSFGLANIGVAQPVRQSRAKRHNCGRFGRLTVPQIAAVAGITKESAYERIRSGRKGAALCVPKRSDDRRKSALPCRSYAVAVAVRLALVFLDHAPTTKEIQAVRPMSRSAASRWRQAFRDVMGEVE